MSVADPNTVAEAFLRSLDPSNLVSNGSETISGMMSIQDVLAAKHAVNVR